MTEDIPPGGPIQHLGAASREMIPEDSDLDGDFASSAEADAAEAAMEANYDTELTDRDLQYIIDADTAAREKEQMVGTMRDYFTEGAEGYYEGYQETGEAISAQARVQEARAEEAV